MIDFRERFKNYLLKDNLRLLEKELPIKVYYGRNKNGLLTLAARFHSMIKMPKSTKLLEFYQAVGADGYWAYICLSDENVSSTFYAFCDDVVESLSSTSTEEEALDALLERIRIWKKMFSPKRAPLSQEQIQGLFGELYFLDHYLVPMYDKERAIGAWGGPLGMSKDFTVGLEWYEVKCAAATETSVRISSHEQLLAEEPGHLVIVRVERMAEGFNNGISTLNSLFNKIKGYLNDRPDLLESFLNKMNRVGYAPDDMYDEVKFSVTEVKSYCVDDKFPRLTSPTSFGDAICGISYRILINALAPFEEGML